MHPVAVRFNNLADSRRAAVGNTLFNLIGVVALPPILVPSSQGVVSLVGEPQVAVAWAHPIFNLAAAALGFLFLRLVVAGRRASLPRDNASGRFTPLTPPSADPVVDERPYEAHR